MRTHTWVPNRFDDWVTVFYHTHDKWIFDTFPATTDPGLYFLGEEKVLNDEGTAILKEGQCRTAYKLGRHGGEYRTLVQARPVTVIRDFDRDGTLDLETGREETGLFGINIQRARSEGTASTTVGRWSAGGQVLADPRYFDHLIRLCEKGAQHFGNGLRIQSSTSGTSKGRN